MHAEKLMWIKRHVHFHERIHRTSLSQVLKNEKKQDKSENKSALRYFSQKKQLTFQKS